MVSVQYGAPFWLKVNADRASDGRLLNHRVDILHRVRRLHHHVRCRIAVHRQESLHLERVLSAGEGSQPVIHRLSQVDRSRRAVASEFVTNNSALATFVFGSGIG